MNYKRKDNAMNYKTILVGILLAGSMHSAWGMYLGSGETVLGNSMGFFFINRALRMCRDRGIKNDHPEFKNLLQKAIDLQAANTREDAILVDKNFDIGIQAGFVAAELEKALATYDNNAKQLQVLRIGQESNNNNNTKEQS